MASVHILPTLVLNSYIHCEGDLPKVFGSAHVILAIIIFRALIRMRVRGLDEGLTNSG